MCHSATNCHTFNFVKCFTEDSVSRMIQRLFNIVQWWNDTERAKPKYSGGNPVRVPLCPPQISHRLAWPVIEHWPSKSETGD